MEKVLGGTGDILKMGVDIDKFLDKYQGNEKSEEGKERGVEQVPDVNLDFQKEVEDKIQDVVKKSKGKELVFLEKIYEEVKKFDEDLPNKFFGIEKSGAQALDMIGSEYTNEYLKTSKAYVKNLMLNISSLLQNIDEQLNKKQYTTMLKELQQAKTIFYQFPRGFMKEKNQASYAIKQREIRIYEAVEAFKDEKTKEIRIRIKKEIQELDACLKKSDPDEIEKKLSEIDMFMLHIPKILMASMTKEKKMVAEASIKVEKHLEKLYLDEFEKRKNEMLVLFEKFQNYYLKKELENCVLIYDEISNHFNKIPDIFLEDKITLYSQMHKMFASINKLILNNNVTMFLETYKNSKIIEEVKEFIEQSRNMKSINTQNLELIIEKISSLPDSYKLEKAELVKEIEKLVEKAIYYEKNDLSTIMSGQKNDPSSSVKVKEKINELYNKLKKARSDEEVEEYFAQLMQLVEKLDYSSKDKEYLVSKIRSTYLSMKNKSS